MTHLDASVDGEGASVDGDMIEDASVDGEGKRNRGDLGWSNGLLQQYHGFLMTH